MATEVKIAQFKARLSEHLRVVRRGGVIVIKDRETPIARVVPYETHPNRLVTRPPTRPLREIERWLKARPKPKFRVKLQDLEEAHRAVKMDYYDKWKAGRFT